MASFGKKQFSSSWQSHCNLTSGMITGESDLTEGLGFFPPNLHKYFVFKYVKMI